MKIGDLAGRAGCTVETVRYYEREGLLPEPERGANNYRVYGAEHLEALSFIRNCRTLEMSLGEIRALIQLKLDPCKDCNEVNVILDEHIEHVAERIERLTALKGQLTALRGRCARIRAVSDCAILHELSEPVEDGRAAKGCLEPHVRGARCAHAKNAS